jgi:chromosome segregation protein
LREQGTKIFARIAELEREQARLEVRIEYEEKGNPLSASHAEETLRLVERELAPLAESDDISSIRRALTNVLMRIRAVFSGGEKKETTHTLDVQKQKITSELSALTKEAAELRKKEEVIATTEREANAAFQGEFENLEKKKDALRAYEAQMQSSHFEREKIQLRREEIEREWLAFGREKDELEKLSRPSEKFSDEREAERRMFRLRGQLAEVGDIDSAMLQEAEESEKRHEFLSSELKDVEAAVLDLKKLVRDLDARIKEDFENAFESISDAFQKYFSLMFGGGRAKLKLQKIRSKSVSEEGEEAPVLSEEDEEERPSGVEIEVSVPKKKITNLEMLSGGEKSLVSLAALFALISVSPPPFLVLDEIDAALDEANARRFSELVKNFSTKSQFIIVTHNRATMEAAEALYGVTMADDGVSKLLSMKFDDELTQKAA